MVVHAATVRRTPPPAIGLETTMPFTEDERQQRPILLEADTRINPQADDHTDADTPEIMAMNTASACGRLDLDPKYFSRRLAEARWDPRRRHRITWLSGHVTMVHSAACASLGPAARRLIADRIQ